MCLSRPGVKRDPRKDPSNSKSVFEIIDEDRKPLIQKEAIRKNSIKRPMMLRVLLIQINGDGHIHGAKMKTG